MSVLESSCSASTYHPIVYFSNVNYEKKNPRQKSTEDAEFSHV